MKRSTQAILPRSVLRTSTPPAPEARLPPWLPHIGSIHPRSSIKVVSFIVPEFWHSAAKTPEIPEKRGTKMRKKIRNIEFTKNIDLSYPKSEKKAKK
jgi:hypothetical protein